MLKTDTGQQVAAPIPESAALLPAPLRTSPAFDVQRIREDFPLLAERIHGKTLVYLDNAASTQKPRAVLDALQKVYTSEYANVHRGVHLLSQRATRLYEESRIKAQRFLNAQDAREIIFVRGTTEAINLVASSYGRKFIRQDDEILITAMEHHSNIVPWQLLCEQTGARLKVVPMTDTGELRMDEFEKLLGLRTRMVAVCHVSNALGTVNPIERIIEMAHQRDIPVLLDGAQSAPHMKVDVQALDCDFFAFSGHKVYGPTGIGVLYGKARLLEAMPPYQGGGDMIRSVTFEKTTYNSLPYKFEAGTPNIADAIALGTALDYVNAIGLDAIAAYEHDLLDYATECVSHLEGVRVIGTAPERSSLISFVMEGIHPHDIGTILDQQGIAVRAGHHCAMPVMDRFGIPATTRASIALYNTKEEIDALVAGIDKVREVFA